MKRALLTLLTVALLLIAADAKPKHRKHRPKPPPPQSSDLTVIDVGGKMCGIDGAAVAGTEKAKLNDLKNRFRLPTGDFSTVTFDELVGLNQGQIQNNAIVNFPGSSDANNQRAVTLEGYVDHVSPGGCSAGESCNCKTQNPKFCDTHINVYPDANSVNTAGHNMYVVEITPRIRLLAANGLLSSNVGNDWSTNTLKPKLEHHRVRFSGFLYFDTDHVNEAWVSDPQDKVGGANWRQTCWEVHPVMNIQVLN
jgi:hypothetical protein